MCRFVPAEKDENEHLCDIMRAANAINEGWLSKWASDTINERESRRLAEANAKTKERISDD